MKEQSPTSINELEQQALSQLNSGHYKEAVALYKKLYLESDDKKWQQQLAYCYLQRALSFSARGMIKEALVLWENYTQHAEPPYDHYDHYICWLIETKNQAKTQLALKALSAQQLDKQHPEFAALLGLLMLNGHTEFQQDLPQDTAFISHFNAAQTALQDNRIDSLKQLPYRSAFRDFRTLFTAAQSFPVSIDQTLAKIPVESAYSQAARLLFSCTLDGSVLVQDLAQFSHKQRRMIAEIKGFDKQQQKFIESLIQHKDNLSDKIKFNTAIQYQKLCGSALSQNFCQAMLANYPAGRRDFNKHFKSINAFESNRLKALTSEHEDNSYDAEHYWRLCIDALNAEDTDNSLKIALILRHIAEQYPDPYERNQLLIESLDYDPEDLTSYLKVIHFFSPSSEDTKDYKEWLKKTLDKFPKNIDVLSLAIKTATNNKAYKKASQYATKILKIDPLNTFAKDILFSSYLAHARRLIQTKKYHLVEKEIKSAEDLKLGKNYINQTQLIRGLFCFADQDKKQGLELIVEALNKSHMDPVNAYFQATMEALLTGLPVTTILKGFTSPKGYLLTVQELTKVVQQLNHYGKDPDNEALLHKAIDKVKPALKASIGQQDYTEELILTFCQTLTDINAFELLRHCAKSAVTKWKKPIWQYYQIYSALNGSAEEGTYSHIHRLEKIREQAFIDKDNRAMVLIDAFMNLYYQSHPDRNMGFLDGLFGFDEEEDIDEDYLVDGPLEQLFQHLSEDVQVKLGNQMEKLTQTTSPERLIADLANDLGNNRQVLLAMMQDPDLFTALMLIKSANSLELDIDLSINDVLEAFNIGISSNSSPF